MPRRLCQERRRFPLGKQPVIPFAKCETVPRAAYCVMCILAFVSKAENWNLAASRRRQCGPQGGQPMRYERWAVILHPLGPSTINCYEKWRYLGAPFGGAGTAQAVTEGVLFHWQDTPSVKNQRFLPPPSKRKARKRKIPIWRLSCRVCHRLPNTGRS